MPTEEKKGKDTLKVSKEVEAPAAVAKKDKKRKETEKAAALDDMALEVEGEETVGKKGKRKVTKPEDKSTVPAKETKKKRKDAPAKEVEEDVVVPKTKKSKIAASAEEPTSSLAKPTLKEERKVKTKSVKISEPESESELEAAEESEAEEQEQELYGFESDDADSSDEEITDDIPGIDIGKLPTIAKDDATVKRKLEKAKRKPTEDRGVIYLGRIPHGFYEDQMKAYFSQFGDVTRLRLSRNKKTGKPKHYAFIEFDSSSVARIVAETMDNYLLMGHILTCKLIPKDQVHPELWVGANRKWRPVPRARVARVAHNRSRTEDELEKAEARLLKRQEQRKRKLEEAGIKYDFEAVAYKKKPKPTEA
ncbi:hypothetical protein DICSQDRAFT_124880 [Dichomitus squalens LYAD-421 SS1]|uniref:uncharacterized protein n=1 Tax=Dichomitus squalens (strain LYAD-421) TaxID=732165 RepID=UPI000441169A|nr:uncharacterized protein DICSQDRAFT_124880 [Dichomitus squalens LYAD-421 SS1]EJF64689.1 hypothetical protein DICSQDRAFT_124880 [Dichomitus squalens LYAD-421 SS1]